MQITPAMLRNLYATLYCCYPFTKWNMPLPEEIKFEVIDDKSAYAFYTFDEGEDYAHKIQISKALCGHFMTVLRSLCHECVHMSRWAHSRERWSHHDKVFKQRCKQVAEEFGLDPLEL